MNENLSTYLNDHLGASKAARELLGSLIKNTPDAALVELASRLLQDLNEEAEEIEQLDKAIGGSGGGIKKIAGWVSAQAARLKIDDASSKLGTFEAVEALVIGVTGKKALWTTLLVLSGSDFRLVGVDFQAYIERSDEQIAQLESKRLQLAISAFETPR